MLWVAVGAVAGAAALAALGDSHARLRSIIDSAVDGIVVIDAKGRIDAFNPASTT